MQRHDDELPRIDIETEDGEDYATMALAEPIARQAQILTDAEQAPQTLGELANLFARRQAFHGSRRWRMVPGNGCTSSFRRRRPRTMPDPLQRRRRDVWRSMRMAPLA